MVSPRIQSRSLMAWFTVPPSHAEPKPRTSVSRWAGVSSARESAFMAYAGEVATGRLFFPQARVCSSLRLFTSRPIVSATRSQSRLTACPLPRASR